MTNKFEESSKQTKWTEPQNAEENNYGGMSLKSITKDGIVVTFEEYVTQNSDGTITDNNNSNNGKKTYKLIK